MENAHDAEEADHLIDFYSKVIMEAEARIARLREALVKIAGLPDAESDDACIIAQSALDEDR